MSTFATTYRAIVLPDLLRRAETAARYLASDTWGWSEAESFVLQEMYRRGASRLPEYLASELEDYLAGVMLKHESEMRPRVERCRRQYALKASALERMRNGE